MLPFRSFAGSFLVAAALATLAPGCALLFPDRTAPKSSEYDVKTPGAPWHKLAVGDDPSSTDAMKADLAFENPETGAIISVNSICRKYNKLSLEQLTENLVRGVGERKMLDRKEITLDGVKSLDSLFEGRVEGVYLHLRTVVALKDDCTYDFIHVSVPKREVGHPHAFDEFLASFHTK
jgi:hypothetical protein